MRTLNERKLHDCVRNLHERYNDSTKAKSEQWLSSYTTTNNKINKKQDYSKMFCPPVIINKNYTPDQQGQEIQQEDVVRPVNHKITMHDETSTWQEISRSRAPTYGSCEGCFRSGPLGKRCNRCNNDEYQAILLLVKGGGIQTLDLITMSEIMGQGHEVCLADHEMNWIRTPSRHYNSIRTQLVIERRYNDIKDEHVRNTLRRSHWFLFLEWMDKLFD